MSTLGRIDFAAKRKIVTVEIEELGGSFRLRALSVGQINELNQNGDVDQKKQALILLARSIVDDDGKQVYQDSEMDQLAEMSPDVMTVLNAAIAKLNGWDKASAEATAKNSETVPSTDSASA